jgi:hypothetical protein
MKMVHGIMALVTSAGLFALWVARSSTGVSEVPRAAHARSSDSEPAAEGRVSPKPSSVPTSGSASALPGVKTMPPGSEAPGDPSAELRRRIAPLNRSSRDPGESEREAIRATAEYLSIPAASLPDFEGAARQSVLEVELALAALKADLEVLAQSQLSPAPGSSGRRLAEARYAVARRNALDRLQPFLSRSAHAKEFQWGFDSWAAAVSTPAEQVPAVSPGK